MRCFFGGALGALILFLIAAIIIPQYSDYRAAAETSRWLAQMEPIRLKIEENAKKLKTTAGAGKHIDLPVSSPPAVTFF